MAGRAGSSALPAIGDIVRVSWVDSQGTGHWHARSQAVRDAVEETMACETVGWLLDETDTYLLVCGSHTATKDPHDEQVDHVMQIPRCAVTGSVVLCRVSR